MFYLIGRGLLNLVAIYMSGPNVLCFLRELHTVLSDSFRVPHCLLSIVGRINSPEKD